jgi:hypothetical protein
VGIGKIGKTKENLIISENWILISLYRIVPISTSKSGIFAMELLQ